MPLKVFKTFSFSYLVIHLVLLTLLANSINFPLILQSDWMEALGFNFLMLGDHISVGFMAFVSLISFSVMKYSEIYMGAEYPYKRFINMVNLFILSMFILLISPNFLTIMVGWDGLGVTSFLLVIYYNNPVSLSSGLVTIYLNRLGDFFMVFSLYYLFYSKELSMSQTYLKKMDSLIFILLLAAMTKSAQLPFSCWLPAAMAAPTPVSSLVHSSTLVTAGVYLFMRFFYLVEAQYITIALSCVFIITSLASGIIACYEADLKKLVAMSTLSQLGLMMFIISLGEATSGFIHMVCHALFKALLFLSCGIVIMNSLGNQDSRFMTGMSLSNPAISSLMAISVISLMGFPFMAGFYSKDSIIESYMVLNPSMILFSLLFIVCVLTGLYGLKGLLIMSKLNFSGDKILGAHSPSIMWFGMCTLAIHSISLGKVMFMLLMSVDFQLLSLLKSVMGLIIMTMGGLLAFAWVWNSAISLKPMKYFFVEVLFLNWIFGGLTSSLMNLLSAKSVSDKTWSHLLGPYGALENLRSLSMTQPTKIMTIKSSFLSFVLLAMLVSFTFSL